MTGGEVSCRESMEGAEVFDLEGPLQQVQLLNLLLGRSMMFTPCPFRFHQVVTQSHQDLIPIVVILFDQSDESINVIRRLNENTGLVNVLDSCLVVVAHHQTPSMLEILDEVGEDPHPMRGPQVLILQKLGLSKRQIVGMWLSGNDINPEEVIQNVKLNLQNIKAIKIQRQMLEDTRTLKEKQDAELKLSEIADAGKEVLASPAAAAEIVSVTAAEAETATDTLNPAKSVGEAAVGYTAPRTDNILSFPPVLYYFF
ncbi:uncharacterized protein [Montipora capricornis]|uniref:uncharacterized protein isoform X1 n=2 Tax=Montipora capricornis TaxID=246305 RepID=UPI0035F18D81